MSPRPTDASCWRGLASADPEGRLRTYRVSVEPLPALVRMGDCGEAAGSSVVSVVNDGDAGFCRTHAEDDS